MPDDLIRKPTALRSLNVLNGSAKVEELRAQFAADQSRQMSDLPSAQTRAMMDVKAVDTTSDSTGTSTPPVDGTAPNAVPASSSAASTQVSGGSALSASNAAGDPGSTAAKAAELVPLATQTLIERAVDPTKSAEQKAITEKIIDALRKVYDPEIPLNVYDLGLIYAVDVGEDRRVQIKMTLTAPACPVAGMLVKEVEQQAESVDEVVSATVELVWEPAWGRHCMSEAALLELGLL